tara:strand:+ start:42 stop:383 length:342 start_codon:yes stop_codon:yes gene_type:complete
MSSQANLASPTLASATLVASEGQAHTLLARIERHPDRALFDELSKVDPRAQSRYQVLRARQSQLRVEASMACAGPRETLSVQVPRLARKLEEIVKAEHRALQEAYLQDFGGEA